MYSAIGDEWLNYLGVSGSKNCTKNLDRPNQPIQSLLQRITLLLVGLADLARAVCPSYPYIHPSIQIYIHPSIYTSIHTFIQTSIHSKNPSKRFIHPYSGGLGPKDYTVSGPNQPPRQDEVFLRVPLARDPASKQLPHSKCILEKISWLLG